MKLKPVATALITMAVIFYFGSSTALAQAQQGQQQQQYSQQQTGQQNQQQMQDLQGKQVSTRDGEQLGTVEEIVQDSAGAQSYVMLSRQQNRVTIPMEKINRQGDNVTADVNLSELQQFAGQQGQQQGSALDQILGKQVQGKQGENLGTINNIVLGLQDGPLAVLEGRNQEKYPIPLQALQQSQQGFRIDQDQQDFETAPSYSDKFLDLNEWQNVIRGYYGVETGQRQDRQAARQQQTGQQQQRQDQGEADITVRQPAPQVTVDQPEPRVQVQQQQPQVTVTQKPPQVQVTQAPPQVEVIQPAPQVTVHQPEPEVRVSQPPPQVTVNQPQPEVQVRMPQPQVNVAQPEPEVRVQQAEPEVRVERAQPQVSVQEQGQPEVMIQRQGEPQVTVQRQGQAKVDVQRQGEAEVNVVREQDQQTRQAQQGQQAQQTDVRNWVARKVEDFKGEELGSVNDVIDEGGATYVLIETGEGTIHPVPADMLRQSTQGEGLRARFEKRTLEQSPSFESRQELEQGGWQQDVRGYFQEQAQTTGAGRQQNQQQQ